MTTAALLQDQFLTFLDPYLSTTKWRAIFAQDCSLTLFPDKSQFYGCWHMVQKVNSQDSLPSEKYIHVSMLLSENQLSDHFFSNLK